MQRPHVDHNNCVLRDEIPLVPVILDDIVVLTKFVHRVPAEDFLKSVGDAGQWTLTMARIYGRCGSSSNVGVRLGPTTLSNSSCAFSTTLGFDRIPTKILFSAWLVVSLPASIIESLTISWNGKS